MLLASERVVGPDWLGDRTRAIEAKGQPSVKTVKQACTLRASAFEPTRRDTVLDLTDLVDDRVDPAEFFAENHITEGMKTLLTEGFRRLEGKSTQGVSKLTQYRSIDDVDVAYQLTREQAAGDTNPIQDIIEGAVRTASNHLIPHGLPDHLWRRLGPEEKLYLKGLEIESHGEFRTDVYQEFARGFGVRDYRFLLRSDKANETRLKTASEFQRRELGDTSFGRSPVRHALYAVWRTAETDDVVASRTWLRTEVEDYWQRREALASVLRYLAALDIDHWLKDATAARLVAGAVEHGHV